jgi:transposase
MVHMPAPYPKEFREDVVRVARRGEQPLVEVARDFGISEGCLHNWLKAADFEDGVREGLTAEEKAEVRAVKARNRVLEEENLILRRAAAFFAKDISPK